MNLVIGECVYFILNKVDICIIHDTIFVWLKIIDGNITTPVLITLIITLSSTLKYRRPVITEQVEKA